jgi:hypothetical protein
MAMLTAFIAISPYLQSVAGSYSAPPASWKRLLIPPMPASGLTEAIYADMEQLTGTSIAPHFMSIQSRLAPHQFDLGKEGLPAAFCTSAGVLPQSAGLALFIGITKFP